MTIEKLPSWSNEPLLYNTSTFSDVYMLDQSIAERYDRKLSKAIEAVRYHDSTVRAAAQQYSVFKCTRQDDAAPY